MARLIASAALLALLIPGSRERPFEIEATIEVGGGPHGIRFSVDGDTAYVALGAEGRVAVVDLTTNAVVAKWEAGTTPLDLLRIEDGWLVTQFRDSVLLRLDQRGRLTGEPIRVAPGPSLFTPHIANGRWYLTSEFGDRVTVFADGSPQPVAMLATGDRPYPADALPDGSLAFVPNLEDGTVTVLDVLERAEVATVDVCDRPAGGASTADGVSYLVACGGSDEIVYLNTASFEVTRRVDEGVGPRPFSLASIAEGRYAVINNAASNTVSVLDVEGGVVVQRLEVGDQPIVVRAHPDGRRVLVSNEVSGTVTVLRGPPASPAIPGDEPNQVVVMGMIHGGHETSRRFGLDVIRDLVREIDPDYWLIELPPNRLERALKEFEETGEVQEPRMIRFPEYMGALFPLTEELDFEVVATAGWNRFMAAYRSRRLREISEDPAWSERWAEYEAASTRSDSAARAGGEPDDPRWIHTDAYDAALEIRYSVYDRLFNDHIGPGGWDRINRAHYAHIENFLDRHPGRGLRVLITYGAGHKGWFLRELRRRDDIELLDMAPFLDQVGR